MPASKAGKGELTLHVRLQEQSAEQTIANLQKLLDDKKQLKDLLNLVSEILRLANKETPRPNSV